MISVLAQAAEVPFEQPAIDYHALAPEIVVGAAIVIVFLADLFLDERRKWATSSLAGLGLLAGLIPVATLAVDSGLRYLSTDVFRAPA